MEKKQVMVQITNECCTIQRAKAFYAEDYDPEEDDSGDYFTKTFESLDEARQYFTESLEEAKVTESWKRKTSRLALERLEWL